MNPSSITHYRIGEVAKIFKKSVTTIRTYVREGQLIAERGKNRQLWFNKQYINALNGE